MIQAVINYVRALPNIDDIEAICKDVFDYPEKDPKVKKLRESLRYFHKGKYFKLLHLTLEFLLGKND